MVVTWTDESLTHIADIYAHIAKDSPYQAGRFTDALMASVEKQLSAFPQSGRELPGGKDPNLRLVIYRNYRVIYYIKPECVYIRHVENCAKNLTQKRIRHIKKRDDK